MKVFEKIFGGVKMTWLRLIVFSVLVGVLVGLIMLCPAFKNNAIREIGVGYEMWFILAIFVVSNCSGTLDAGLKCFVFFLISQPLIYLVQQPFAEINLLKTYYGFWFKLTLATFPGGMIAYQIKRKDLLGTLILAVAGIALGVFGIGSVVKGLTSIGFSYVIYGLVQLAAIVIFAFLFCPGKKLKAVFFAPILICMILYWVLFGSRSAVNGTYEFRIDDGHTYVMAEGSFRDSTIRCDGDVFTIIYSSSDASAEFECINELGETKAFTMKIVDKQPVIEEK